MITEKKDSIILLIPYYGKWPSYIHLFNDSVKNNPLIDVYFITDIDFFPNPSNNVHFISCTYNNLISKISSVLEITIPQFEPYKLCDFRPAYGIIFSDIIRNYKFWGYGDIDLIFGKLDKFLTQDLLNSFDIITFNKLHLQGPFTIFRNDDYVNNLFRMDDYYKEVFSNKDYLSFDEFGKTGFHVKMNSKNDILSQTSDNISVIALKEELKNNIKIYLNQHAKENLSLSEIVVYINGRVYNYHTNENYSFYHWVLEKRAIWFRYARWFNKSPNKYYISSTGFYSENLFRFYSLIHYFRLFTGTILWLILKIINYIRRKMGLKVRLDTSPRIGWVKKINVD